MANQNSVREIADKFNLSQGGVHKTILQVLKATCELAKTCIQWPNSVRKQNSTDHFLRICGIDRVIGSIDGCHIKIQRPHVRGIDYMNRKVFHSILLQGIVDEHGRIIDVFVWPPGRVHDSRMLSVSPFFNKWEDRMEGQRLLGDTAYIGSMYPFIVTPKRDNGTLSPEEECYNTRLSQGRVVVEHAFGRLKCRWRRIK